MKTYEFLYQDGSYHTLMECEDPQKEIENIQTYAPNVTAYREYIEPAPPEIIGEEEFEIEDATL